MVARKVMLNRIPFQKRCSSKTYSSSKKNNQCLSHFLLSYCPRPIMQFPCIFLLSPVLSLHATESKVNSDDGAVFLPLLHPYSFKVLRRLNNSPLVDHLQELRHQESENRLKFQLLTHSKEIRPRVLAIRSSDVIITCHPAHPRTFAHAIALLNARFLHLQLVEDLFIAQECFYRFASG